MATRGRVIDILALDGLVAERGGEWLGYAAYEVVAGAMEIALLESRAPGSGAGSALLAACVAVADERNLGRVWLISTNDNTNALRFYQRRGFILVAIHRDAVTAARRAIKPEIPLTGDDDIPIRDEIELELPRAQWRDFTEQYAWPRS